MRNMEKTARKTHEVKNQTRLDGYDLTLEEYKRLKDMILDGKCPEAVSMAFNYGFALGHRATVAGKVTKKI